MAAIGHGAAGGFGCAIGVEQHRLADVDHRDVQLEGIGCAADRPVSLDQHRSFAIALEEHAAALDVALIRGPDQKQPNRTLTAALTTIFRGRACYSSS